MMDDSEEQSSNPRACDPAIRMQALIQKRLDRRHFLKTTARLGYLAMAGCTTRGALRPTSAKGFGFTEIARGSDSTHHLAKGHDADILLRWGDALFTDSPPFDPYRPVAAAQRRQFGYNNDFIGFIPFGSAYGSIRRGLLCVNHEYTTTALMFPGLSGNGSITAAHCETELAAHGGSIVEIELRNQRWRPVIGGARNRRITGDTTPIRLSGPAAGHRRLQTSEDKSGRMVAGTLNNCAGGITPWGTYLMAEENFNGCFSGRLATGHDEAQNHARYGVPGGWYAWGRFFNRYTIAHEPNEPNRYGWIVEVDPQDPTSTPKKRTALGRFKHEGAETVIAPDGRVVIYMGDDQQFDYLYKFVSFAPVNRTDRAANRDILDTGTLYVAKFDADGTLEWMGLEHGKEPLTEDNGFYSQADVVIEARRAADLLGATPMDRPEDVEPDARSGSVWVMLTNNNKRTKTQTNAANPRAQNHFGHIIEIIEPRGDFTARRSRWEFLVHCGDPETTATGAVWNPKTSKDGWFACPDNCAVDPLGRLWVATDGNSITGAADGLWAMETSGMNRGTGRAFFRAPIGAEVCGPRFTPDGKTLFLSVQHPGDGDGTSFEKPATRWPDFDPDIPPRPAVLAIRKTDGGLVGT